MTTELGHVRKESLSFHGGLWNCEDFVANEYWTLFLISSVPAIVCGWILSRTIHLPIELEQNGIAHRIDVLQKKTLYPCSSS